MPFFIFYFLFFYGNLATTTLINFNHKYNNLTTHGKLVPNLYQLIKTNDTNPHGVRVVVVSRESETENAIIVQVAKRSDVLVTTLPRTNTFEGYSYKYWKITETLCESFDDSDRLNETVRVSVSSSVPAVFDLEVQTLFNFEIDMKPVAITFSPSEPVFYKFKFPDGVDMIAIKTDSSDNLCARIIVKKAQCPVFDTEGQAVLLENYIQQTIIKKGFVTVKREEYGDTIHVIFTVLPRDCPCLTRSGSPQNFTLRNDDSERIKRIVVTVMPRKNYWISFFVVGGLFVLIILFILCLGAWLKNANDPNYIPREVGTILMRQMSLSQCLIFIPMSLILVLVKYTDSGLFVNLDTCNYNFMCGISIFGLSSVNNILSSLSITVAGIVNFLIPYVDWERLIPLNIFITVTGFLWASMNMCPQKHTFHLYTLSMIYVVLEATLLVVGIRNSLPPWHQNMEALFAMLWMFVIVIDTALVYTFTPWYFWCCLFMINTMFIVCFFNILGYDIIKNIRSVHTCQVVQPIENTDEIEQEEDVPLLRQLSVENDPRILLNGRQRRAKHPESKTAIQCLLLVFIISLLTWTIAPPLLDNTSTFSVLCFVQTNFAVYFLYYICNKVMYETNFWKLWKFGVLFVSFAVCVALWIYITAHHLPAFVPWSPAESRSLNSECLISEITGTDWHDVLHYTTALICLIFPALISFIDENVSDDDVIMIF